MALLETPTLRQNHTACPGSFSGVLKVEDGHFQRKLTSKKGPAAIPGLGANLTSVGIDTQQG
jgi:hypothetical protein